MTTVEKVDYAPDRGMAYFPTPASVADDLVYWVLEPGHGNGEGVRVLEPSAGEGHLARVVREYLPYAHVIAVEPSERAEALRTGDVVDEVVQDTLESYLSTFDDKPFDLVLMNPPFSLPGQSEAWADHILSIYHHSRVMAPAGLLGAVVPRIAVTGKSKRVRKVRELTGCDPSGLSRRGDMEPCEKGAFDAADARVSVALMWAQKPATDGAQ
jgi:predicted RNA methylase